MQHAPVLVGPQPADVPAGGRVPAGVLDEGRVGPQVGAHGLPAARAARHEPGGHAHVPLLADHGGHGPGVVVGGVVAGGGALEEPVVALGVEQAVLGQAGPLEAVVDVRGQDEEVAAGQEREQVGVDGAGAGLVAQEGDVARPVGPLLLRARKGVEAGRVGVGEAVAGDEVGEALGEDGAGVGVSVGDGQARPGPDDDGVRLVQEGGEAVDAGGGGVQYGCAVHAPIMLIRCMGRKDPRADAGGRAPE